MTALVHLSITTAPLSHGASSRHCSTLSITAALFRFEHHHRTAPLSALPPHWSIHVYQRLSEHGHNYPVHQQMYFHRNAPPQVLADVAYEAEGNRLHSTITMAGIKLGPLFIPLPFKGRKGYLDMLYLDDEFRVTKGNRGGAS
eukprot:TRINITY_DN1683_c0_g1_i1.p2 TRINITY_DN1683_c0_g1~~TRINITY_DN1683_c0_g1_i1.p2  ORF type:complete len:143 (-),score=31.72 TRINITY_DN1683_c0_g1_i1:665-1093(-)